MHKSQKPELVAVRARRDHYHRLLWAPDQHRPENYTRDFPSYTQETSSIVGTEAHIALCMPRAADQAVPISYSIILYFTAHPIPQHNAGVHPRNRLPQPAGGSSAVQKVIAVRGRSVVA